MTKQEFEAHAVEVTPEQFNIINFVYTFHPSIDEVAGKQQISDLFLTFGMRIIEDMFPTAEAAMRLEQSIREASLKLEELKEDLRELRNGAPVKVA